jgi:hypothetical protein
MKLRIRASMLLLGAIAVLHPTVMPTAAAQGAPYRAPRLPGTQLPDLNGIWQAFGEANFDIQPHAAGPAPFANLSGAIGAMPASLGIVEGGEIPYQPWALAKKKENFEKRFTRPIDRPTNESAGDPEAKCYMPGVPRAAYLGYPFQIIQATQQVLMSYEFASATRVVHIGREPKAPIDSWMGWSIGRWEGDTLVIDVTNQVDQTWFDRAGNFHSDALHVVERYTRISPDHMRYEATIEDPKVFTRPWKISFPLYRRVEPNAQLLEFKCVEFAEEFMYGHLVDAAK